MSQQDTLLTINAGSSSLKCGLFNADGSQCLVRFKFSDILGTTVLSLTPSPDCVELKNIKKHKQTLACHSIPADERHQFCLNTVLDWLRQHLPTFKVRAFSHRIVHGGEEFQKPQRLTAEVLEKLEAFIPLAPLHQPFNLKLVKLCQNLVPRATQIACFDTMFHVGQATVERYYAIDTQYSEAGIHRYGFHGLSYEYIYQRLEEIDPHCADKKIVVCHLGAGASMCAIASGKSRASSMGFSAVDGLPMGSRTGSIDPGVLLYLQRQHNMDADQLENFLYKQSGWLGVSGISAEMKTLAASSEPRAKLAIDMFCYRAALEIGRLSAALEGLDTIVFTGGVGENDEAVRAQICQRSEWLGLTLNPAANSEGKLCISHQDSRIAAFVIGTDEEAMMARHAHTILSAQV